MIGGGLLLLLPVVYAAVWTWLRGGLRVCLPAPTSRRVLAKVDLTLAKTENTVASVETTVASIDLTVASIETTVASIETTVASIETTVAKAESTLAEPVAELAFSVLVAARDEAAALPRLLAALARQTLAPARFEVLVVDDHSADGTDAEVAKAAADSPFALRLLALPPGATGKKAALTAAISQARAPWVVCTDADCRPGPGWLQAYADLLHDFTPSLLHFISGPVRLTPGGAWFDALLGLEFAGLVSVGGACIGRGRPTMCNGANLAFRRSTFHEVGGYADNAGLASGDDEFLLHKMHQRYPTGIRFLAEARAVVDTPAPATLRALLRQRVRWASKWAHYRTSAPQQLAVLVLGANVSLFAGLLSALTWPGLWPWAAAGWALKLGADAWLLWPLLGLLARRRWLAWLLPLQLLYAPYALAVGLAGQRRQGYRWKGRQVR